MDCWLLVVCSGLVFVVDWLLDLGCCDLFVVRWGAGKGLMDVGVCTILSLTICFILCVVGEGGVLVD